MKTEFGVNHTLSNKVWSKILGKEVIRQTYVGKFIGKDDNSLIREKVELKKDAGDKITCGLVIDLDGEGVQGDATVRSRPWTSGRCAPDHRTDGQCD